MLTKNKGFAFISFLFVFFVTPHLPMPASVYGPVAPLLYIYLFIVFLFFAKKEKKGFFKNNYVIALLLFQFLLVLSDTLSVLIFDFSSQIVYPPIRMANIFIFLLIIFFFLQKEAGTKYYMLNPFMVKLYIISVLVSCIVLYAQAFGILSIGQLGRGRTFFGLQLPFNKPVGLFDASDGKLGIMIAPLFFLFVINAFKKSQFQKLKYNWLIAFLIGILMIILQSRSGYLAFFIAVGLFVLIYPYRFKKLILLSGVIFAILIDHLTSIFGIILIGLKGEGIYEKNVEGRGKGLTNAITNFFKSPLFGVGQKESIRSEGLFDDGHITHNLFLDHLASGGLITFIPLALIFIWFFYYTIKLMILASKRSNGKLFGLSLWLFLSMVYIFVELNFYRGLYNEYVYLFLAFGTLSYLNFKVLKNEKDITYS